MFLERERCGVKGSRERFKTLLGKEPLSAKKAKIGPERVRARRKGAF